MKKLYLPLLVFGLAVVVRSVPKLALSPERRTEAYFSLQRSWMAHWPFDRGRYTPRILLPAVLPVTPVWLQVDPQIRMRLDPADFVSRTILETGQWEPESWQAMHSHLERGATFVDVGAQIGYYSLKAAAVVGPAGHVIAIEPNPQTIAKLEANIAASCAGVIAVERVACSDADTMLDLYAAAPSNTGETSLSRANASQSGAVVRIYRVRARPLDDIIREAGASRVDVIKIDVEGAEYLVLKGSQQTLARFHPSLMVEVLDRQLRAMGSSAAQLTDFLKGHGYTARRATGDNVEFDFSGYDPPKTPGFSVPQS